MVKSLIEYSKIKIPPLENLQSNVIYAISLSPQAQWHDTPNRLEKFIKSFQVDIQKCLIYSNYKLYLELSTKSQNYHYHGTIMFPDYKSIVLFYLNINQLKNHSTIEIDTIDNYAVWYTYCTKQRHIMEPYVGFHNLDYKQEGRCFTDKILKLKRISRQLDT